MSPKTAYLLFAAVVSPLALHTTAAQHAPQQSHPETITLDPEGIIDHLKAISRR